MSSLDTLRERGVVRFVHDHPWLFAIGVGLVGAGLALSNGVNPLPAFTNMFLVGAILGLAVSYATDIASVASDRFDSWGEPTTVTAADPLHHLRERYATGELTESEFERKLERLLETETRESASEHLSNRQRDVATE
ncbi:SHOCT domain-containing protein [Haloferax sp. DFSO60]|uniref:SHOCT domain-containing protein n=1 Tax=Haloferax sp. DFSO60 TaxID=3388652 RepID=UPI00397D339B